MLDDVCRRGRVAVAAWLLLALLGAPGLAVAQDRGFGEPVERMARAVAGERGIVAVDSPRGLSIETIEAVWGSPAAGGGAAVAPRGFSLQEPPEPWAPPGKNFWLAFGEAMLVQVLPWTFNAYVRGEDWSRNVGWASWSNSYARSFNWDDNQFVNNQFSHPYHGNLYYTAARTNGFDYYESMAFAFLNSWLWEYHGETFQPAINDWFMTSVGGTAIGEMTYRLSENMTDNTASGARRTWGEIGGFLLSPVRGFDRGIKGQWGRHWDNSPDRSTHVWSHFEIGAFGAKEAPSNAGSREGDETEQVRAAETEFVPFIPAERVTLGSARFELRYGDALQTHRKPFDAFEFDVQLSFGSDVAALGRATITGWLHVNQYDWSEHNRHAFTVTQNYEYFNNEVAQFGAQSFGVGLNSLFRADKNLKLRTRVEGQVIVLGAIDSPYAETVNRTYDYGPGGALRIEARLEEKGFDYIRLRMGSLFIDTINGGGEGRHLVSYGAPRAMFPVFGAFGLGGEVGYIRRDGYFKELPDFNRDNDFARIFVTWTTS